MFNHTPTNIWQFSSSSQDKLQRCLSAAKYDGENKWIQKLKVKSPRTIQDDEEQVTEEVAEVVQTPETIERKEDVREWEEHVDYIREVVDADPVTHFSQVVDMCLKDKIVYNLLLKNLSISSVEKICNHIFNSRNLNSEFMENFYNFFLPEFLKKEHSWLSLDLLVKAKESHGIQYKTLLLTLLNEKEFPTTVLQEFVSTLDANELTSFINNIAADDISNDMFVNNMFTIFLAYKDGHKNESTQNYILKKLSQTAHLCPNDKNYGRFLLTYIQNQKSVNNLETLEKIVALHRSAFKRPCINALNALKNS